MGTQQVRALMACASPHWTRNGQCSFRCVYRHQLWFTGFHRHAFLLQGFNMCVKVPGLYHNKSVNSVDAGRVTGNILTQKSGGFLRSLKNRSGGFFLIHFAITPRLAKPKWFTFELVSQIG